jgi:hypothetical protein
MATVSYQYQRKDQIKASKFIKSTFNLFQAMSDFGIMQGGPWFYKNHIFEHVSLIFESLIIKTS